MAVILSEDQASRPTSAPELVGAVGACASAFIGVAVLTAVVNLIYLNGTFFMLEMYDRVIPSKSIPTLIGLCALALLVYAFQAGLDVIRGRLLVRIGCSLDEDLSGRMYGIVSDLALRPLARIDCHQPVRDLEQLRTFLSGNGPLALFDLPWMPLYLGICFVFHPLVGLTALVGGLLLTVMTLLTERLTRGHARILGDLGASRSSLGEAARRNAEAVHALGMANRMTQRWCEMNRHYLERHRRMADVVGGLSTTSRVMRLVIQSAVLAVGAYLVIGGQATSGIMIASSVLTSRALAPVELAISNWKGFVSARQSWRRLSVFLNAFPLAPETLALPRPEKRLNVEHISAAPPGSEAVTVKDVSFVLNAGQGLGVVGPSGSGKSSLARVIVGVWSSVRGAVRLDEASLDQWSPAALGRDIGYLPQDVELFAGTVAENIARFEPEADARAVIDAARAAGVHDMILRLPAGYSTRVGEAGGALSAGQRQRIALARALYGDPFLVVLDEPNSNLDLDGEQALAQAILDVRKRGGIVVVIAHRPSVIAALDYVLVMNDGQVQSLGPREEVFRAVVRRASSGGANAGAGETAVLRSVRMT